MAKATNRVVVTLEWVELASGKDHTQVTFVGGAGCDGIDLAVAALEEDLTDFADSGHRISFRNNYATFEGLSSGSMKLFGRAVGQDGIAIVTNY